MGSKGTTCELIPNTTCDAPGARYEPRAAKWRYLALGRGVRGERERSIDRDCLQIFLPFFGYPPRTEYVAD